MTQLFRPMLFVFTAISIVFSTSAISAGAANERVAVAIAETVDAMVRSTRATYTNTIVAKLKKDGKGAKQASDKAKGYIPLPAQFIRHVALNSKAPDSFEIVLRSAWNLNPNQGLQDSFERAGWEDLLKQQEAAGGNLKGLKWKPYIRKAKRGGKNVLRYFSADIAAGESCVRCHNKWENRPKIKNMRQANGTLVGKKFKLNELMGAVSVTVPLL